MNQGSNGAILSGWGATSMARRRFQRGSLWRDEDRWIARWREDQLLPRGSRVLKGDKVLSSGEVLHRPYRQEILAWVKDYPTLRLARRLLEERLREVNHEDYRPSSSETFGRFAKRWMETVMIHNKPSTQSSAKSIILRHLIPAFGSMPIEQIRTEVLQAWIAQQTLGSRSVRNMVKTLRAMWVTAKAWGYARSNPFADLRLPSTRKPAIYHFSVEEALAIIAKARGWEKLFFRLLAETGMRPGELAGLRRQDVQGRILEISQSVWCRRVQTPKTATAQRRIAISIPLSLELDHHLRTVAPNQHGLVFVEENGKLLDMDYFRKRVLDRILRELGIWDKVRSASMRGGMYAFRHMNATLMDQLGTPMKNRQERLGHAQITTTLNWYSHPTEAADILASDQLGALLNPSWKDPLQ